MDVFMVLKNRLLCRRIDSRVYILNLYWGGKGICVVYNTWILLRGKSIIDTFKIKSVLNKLKAVLITCLLRCIIHLKITAMHCCANEPSILGLATCWLCGNCMNIRLHDYKEHVILKCSALQESSEAENADEEVQELAFILQ